jgi:hypothetical protein
MVNQCEAIFGKRPKYYMSPIDKDSHPKLNMTEEVGPKGIKHYQRLLGAFQWSISLG